MIPTITSSFYYYKPNTVINIDERPVSAAVSLKGVLSRARMYLLGWMVEEVPVIFIPVYICLLF